MKIQFQQDYRGVLTKDKNGQEHFYKKGITVNLATGKNKFIDGEELVNDGRAKKIKDAA